MSSVFTANKLHLEEPSAGDDVGTWNVPVNANMTVIDAGLGGTTSLSLSSSNVTLSTSQYQNLRLSLTGAVSPAISVLIPSGVGGFWLVTNNTTGSAVTVKTTAGGSTGIVPKVGYTTLVYSDGTNVKYGDDGLATNYLPLTGGTLSGSLALPSNGLNVGYGQLAVSGGNVTASGNITATGNVTAYSDRRLKSDIRNLTRALDLVNRLQGVRYRDISQSERVGVIAQDVRNVVPEVVFEDKDGFLHVAYQNLIGVLIEAVKELAIRIDNIENDL